jgi:energy-coupling factor transporter ATP-binding protein EcfA2
MSIDRFAVKGFRGIDAELELGQVNIIAGGNGSGKTNLLEAIALAGVAANGRIDEGYLYRSGIRQEFPVVDSEWHEARLTASFRDACYDVTLARKGRGWRYVRELLREFDEVKSQGVRSGLVADSLGTASIRMLEIDADSAPWRLMSALQGCAIYSPVYPVMRWVLPDPHQRSPIGLLGGRIQEAAFEDPFCIDLVSGVFGGVMWDSTRNAGDGFLDALFVSTLALHELSPSTVIIDGFASSIEEMYAALFTRAICREVLTGQRAGRQLIMSTNNHAVIGSLPLQDDRVRLFRVITVDGVTTVERDHETTARRK